MAKLTFKYGAMNSGKSDVLIKTAYNYTEQGLAVVTIKPAIDTKGENLITARGGHSREVDIIATEEMDLREEIHRYIARQALAELHCVLIDESQFLKSKQIDQLFHVAKIDDISVVAHGLRADFQTQLFEGSRRLFELADVYEKIKTMCSCGKQGEINCRRVNGEYVFVGEQVAIDGEEEVSYNSLCGKCYLTEVAKSMAA